MADPSPVSEDAFAADRAGFFHEFTRFGFYTAVSVVVVVALLGIFLG